jgi:transposase InsO family protein
MTIVRTRAGLLHLSILLDLYSRRIVGWAMGDAQTTELALNALGMALLQRLPKPGLIHHTDRGSAYSSGAYRACLQNNGIVSSMSRAYRCNQNAYAERFFGSLKRELSNNTRFPDKETARTAIFEYIEIFYNRQRRHNALGRISPMEFEERKGVIPVTV